MSDYISNRSHSPLDWPSLAESLSAKFSHDRFNSEVTSWIEKQTEDRPWSIACSGGPDSVCLLLLLYAHYAHRHGDLHILHFNHCMRGEASDSDADFVKKLAHGLDLLCHSGTMDRGEKEIVNEVQAREARYNFFTEIMDTIDSRALFSGHVKEDITETMLMRLARGSGSAGLAAPRPVHYHQNNIVHIRPLLDITKTEIKACLEEQNIPWCDDKSNSENIFLRNRLRNSVLPAWRNAEDRNIDEGAAHARLLLEEDDKALETWLAELEQNFGPGQPYAIGRIIEKPTAIIRRALYHWLDAQNLMPVFSREAIENLLSRILNHQDLRMSAGNKNFIEYKGGWLSVVSTAEEPDWPPVFAPINAEVFLPQGTRFMAETVQIDSALRDSIINGAYDENHYAFLRKEEKDPIPGFDLRRWQPGDRYRPLGSPGTSKLQDIFTNRKISPEERNQLPVVCVDNDTILWIPGLPPADSHKIDRFTNHALRLTYA